MPRFLPWVLFGWPSLLAQCVDLDVNLYYAAVQNMVYAFGNIPHTTAESNYTSPIHCANICSNPPIYTSIFPQDYNTIPYNGALLSSVMRVGSVCKRAVDVYVYGVDLVSVHSLTTHRPQLRFHGKGTISYISRSHFGVSVGKVNSALYMAQIVACLPLVHQVRVRFPAGSKFSIENFQPRS